MNPIVTKTTHHCGRCDRHLPLTEFYLRARTGLPDGYCKECRRAVSRRRHEINLRKEVASEKCSRRIVITEVEDREERLKLILEALRKVSESIAAKKRKEREMEFFKYCKHDNQEASDKSQNSF